MESYKCPKCGLVCWKTVKACKRCQAPNPYFERRDSNLNCDQVVPVISEASLPQLKVANDYVNLQTSHATSASINPTINNPNNVSNRNLGQSVLDGIGSALRAVMPREANLTELEAAKRDIRWAWKAGRIGASLTFGFSLQYIFEHVPYFQYSLAYALFPFILLIPYLGINIGLVYGIYRKSRICAVILFCLAILTVLISLINCFSAQNLPDLGTVFFSILFGYFYWLGVRGTFEYRHLTKP